MKFKSFDEMIELYFEAHWFEISLHGHEIKSYWSDLNFIDIHFLRNEICIWL